MYKPNTYDIQLHDTIESSDIIPPPTRILRSRTPIISILGHKDHGKTTLVDTMRSSNIAKYEEYGITQELYSYTALLHGSSDSHTSRTITILDTPGHYTFGEMRKTAGWFSDINLVVVSCRLCEGLQEQTIEALEVARSYSDTPYIIVINKIDADDADINHIKSQLQQYGLKLVDYTHKFTKLTSKSTVPFIEISAKHKLNFDTLHNAINTTLQRIDLTTDFSAVCRGSVLESYREDKGRGNVVRVIVQHGTLNKNDYFVCGLFSGRVKELRMNGRLGHAVDCIHPGIPIEIMGCEHGLPSPGSEFIVCSESRSIAIARLRRNESNYNEQVLRIQNQRDMQHEIMQQRIQTRIERKQRDEMDSINASSFGQRNAVDEHIANKNDELYEPSVATTFDEVDATVDNSSNKQFNINNVDNNENHAEDDTFNVTDESVPYANIKQLRRAIHLDDVDDDDSPRTIIIKSNHTGGLRMLVDAVDAIHNDVKENNSTAYGLNLLSCNSGGVTKHDIVLAAVDRSPILLFRTQQPSSHELYMAKQAQVPIKHYRHFERLLSDLTTYATTGKLPMNKNKYTKQTRDKQIHKPLIKPTNHI